MDVGLKGVVKDSLNECVLDLYVDADLAGCKVDLWVMVAGFWAERHTVSDCMG